jgi:hypothetical protein
LKIANSPTSCRVTEDSNTSRASSIVEEGDPIVPNMELFFNK